ncbi:unnamed protein product [Spirodela intermedia]|uniref:RING-type E3 ubiquitin transferase n=2 Tax=Spirodela intermedia TaxID=51605 RepID=A0A7I8IHJ9_SPIIN|nr:unnamed protein product [Spirodela intermedia]CAA6657332.1 unnamed protein product [Spirodela intermedia]CAA7393382.1 unnamed protein product [Spirodela intermedia]
MGSICCCLHDDPEDYTHVASPVHRRCIFFRCLSAQLLRLYTALFQREEIHAIYSPEHGTSTVSGEGDGSISDTYRPPPWPLAYDDPRCSPLHHGFARHDKSSSHFYEEPEPLRRRLYDSDTESAAMTDKQNVSDSVGESKLSLSESSVDQTARYLSSEVTYIYPSFEDEDSCPICLEEYTPENPKISMQCSHYFHLGCIYEWMERSDACPVCGKEMAFSEAS